MPKSKYNDIYISIKKLIEDNVYKNQDLLPSENNLIKEYNCSRNTVRRAISHLTNDGYVQPIKGKGVRVIYSKNNSLSFSLGGIETFQESTKRNKRKARTRVILFEEQIVNSALSKITGFRISETVFHIQKVRYIDNIPLILDNNYFLKSIMPELTKEKAENSIYNYLEKDLGVTIVTSKRQITVGHATDQDQKYLDLKDYNCVAIVTNQAYNKDGILFEYTESKHSPDYFSFHNVAIRGNVL
ncbi:MAG: trehalose operon repressor [Coriobacteriia bacterium]|nr:trehalose operon repressor [Coriobacteriia bacterium]